MRQGDQFKGLSDNVQDMVNQLIKQQSDSHAAISKLDNNLTKLAISVERRLVDMQRSSEGRFDKAQSEEQKRKENEMRVKMRERFVQSLEFREMHERRANVRAAASDTFGWIFEDSSSGSLPPPGIKAWLANDASAFWISGKAGSGKSTLMAFLAEHQQTKSSLWTWGNGREVILLSFYFWRTGSEFQRSISGLLRSLLHQICATTLSVIDVIIETLHLNMANVGAWTDTSLAATILVAVKASKSTCYCAFIDGLDEFSGDYIELLDLVFHLQDLDNFKCCVASRPEVRLAARLSSCDHLQLQDLNYQDIKTYARTKISAFQSNSRYYWERGDMSPVVESIAHRADGIFLWAVLVTSSILRGLSSADPMQQLLERIDAAPREMNMLFASMLGTTENVHRRTLAFYLQSLALHGHESSPFLASMCTLTAATMDGDTPPTDVFAERCQRTEIQAIAQSAGLLEVVDMPGNRHETKWSYSADQVIYSPVESCGRSVMQRRQVTGHPFPIVLRYERRRLAWIHRSAYDFIFDPNNGMTQIYAPLDPVDVLDQLWDGALKYLCIAPSMRLDSDRALAGKRLSELMRQASASDGLDVSRSYARLDALRSAAARLCTADVQGTFVEHFDLIDNLPELSTGTNAFWTECLTTNRWEYLAQRTGKLSQCLENVAYAAMFLVQCIAQAQSTRFVEWDHLLTVLDALLHILQAWVAATKCSLESTRPHLMILDTSSLGPHALSFKSQDGATSTRRSYAGVVISRLAEAHWKWFWLLRSTKYLEESAKKMKQLAHRIERTTSMLSRLTEAMCVFYAPRYSASGSVLLLVSASQWQSAILAGQDISCIGKQHDLAGALRIAFVHQQIHELSWKNLESITQVTQLCVSSAAAKDLLTFRIRDKERCRAGDVHLTKAIRQCDAMIEQIVTGLGEIECALALACLAREGFATPDTISTTEVPDVPEVADGGLLADEHCRGNEPRNSGLAGPGKSGIVSELETSWISNID